MANAFVNFLKGATEGSGNLRDWQHASRLYLTNYYELSPKAAWIYYVQFNINPFLPIKDSTANEEFKKWKERFNGKVGLLASSVTMPKFSIKTENINQYNRKTVVQTKIDYEPITIKFHDDMANVTTNLWKSYYQYYFGDSIGNEETARLVTPKKYQNNKYLNFEYNFGYGLNNQQTLPLFVSIDIYQLFKKKFTSFKIVNPLVNDWSHSELDQSRGNEVLNSQMTLDYETVIYGTDLDKNDITKDTPPNFYNEYYDKTPSPLSIGGRGTTSILGPGGLVGGASSIFGTLTSGSTNPFDYLNAALQTNNLIRNAKNISLEGVFEEGSGVFQSVLSGIESDGDIVSGALKGLNAGINPAGIVIPLGSQTTNGQTDAKPSNAGGGG